MSPRRSQAQGVADEETPLLRSEDAPRKPTPLPMTQLCVLLLLLLSEPITSLSINPYINQVCLICFSAYVFSVTLALARQRTFNR